MLLLLLPAAVADAKAADSSPQAARPRKQYTIEQLLKTTAVFGASFSADEKSVLYSSDETGIFNVYTAPAPGGTAPGAHPRPRHPRSASDSSPGTTASSTPTTAAATRTITSIAPDGARKDLTPGKLKAEFAGWSPR